MTTLFALFAGSGGGGVVDSRTAPTSMTSLRPAAGHADPS